jgi:hypothetical protein
LALDAPVRKRTGMYTFTSPGPRSFLACLSEYSHDQVFMRPKPGIQQFLDLRSER